MKNNTVKIITILLLIVFTNACERRIADNSINKVNLSLAKTIKGCEGLKDFKNGLAPIKRNGKWGYIDKEGNLIVPYKYDEASRFINGFAVVGRTDLYGVINNKGIEVISTKYDYLDIFEKYSNKGFIARKGDYYGVLNSNGTIKIPFEYEDIRPFEFNPINCSLEWVAPVKQNGKFGFINESNRMIIPCSFEDISEGYPVFNHGLAAVRKSRDDDYVYIDGKGEIIIKSNNTYRLYGTPFHSRMTPVGKYRTSIFNGKEFYFTNNENAYIYTNGDLASDFQNISLCPFYNEYAVINKIDERGRRISGDGLIDDNFNTILPFEFNLIANRWIEDGIVWLSKGAGKDGFYDINHKKYLIPCEYDIKYFRFDDGLVPAKKGDQWGYLNLNCEWQIPPQFEWASPFSDGFGIVKRYGTYGVVDRYNNITFSY